MTDMAANSGGLGRESHRFLAEADLVRADAGMPPGMFLVQLRTLTHDEHEKSREDDVVAGCTVGQGDDDIVDLNQCRRRQSG